MNPKRERESNKEGAEKKVYQQTTNQISFSKGIYYTENWVNRSGEKKKKFLQHLDFFRNSTVFSLPPSLFQSGNYVLHRLHVQN